MEESMYQRLEAAVKRLKEIDEELVSEDVMKDLVHFREISKERAYLDPQVEAFQRYQKNEADIEEAKIMPYLTLSIKSLISSTPLLLAASNSKTSG